MVGASYGLSMFTQTRYELHDRKVKNVRGFDFGDHSLAADSGVVDDERGRAQVEEGQKKVRHT